MPDIKDYTGKITSEHADKPKYMAMVEAVSQCFLDINQVTTGLPDDFDLDLATDAQLDDVGLWVGISRNIPTPLTNVYFAFDTQGLGFDQGAWKGPFDPDSGITVLDNETYRSLIRAKIGANHWDGTLESSKAILDLIFNPQGHEPFFPVTATNEPFASGDGIQSTFQLRYQGQNVYETTMLEVYKTDWQGQQRIYPTPRTNLLAYSSDFSISAWVKTNTTIIPNATTAPDGTNTASKLISNNTLSEHDITQSRITTADSDVWMSVFVKAAEYTFVAMRSLLFVNQLTRTELRVDLSTGVYSVSGAGNPDAKVQNVGDGWWKLSIKSTRNSTPGAQSRISLVNMLDMGTFINQGDGISGLYVWGGQMEESDGPTSYIQTVSSQVTVTDYTVSTFNDIALLVPLALGASLSWTGQGIAYAKGNYAYITDNQDMTISIGMAGDPPSAIQWALLTGGYITPKPQSVDVKYFYSPSVSGPLFGFDASNQYIAGFDQGSWGNVYS